MKIGKKELSLELQKYKERPDIFEAIRDASGRYKKWVGEIGEKDRMGLIRKFVEKIIVENENIGVIRRVGEILNS